ncbi:MAG TPA: RluA family pseudouridine synthase [Patescibacteria group bacterium]|nr:RluA family pseudouridine synthase [Patescibacteria group bacterium]
MNQWTISDTNAGERLDVFLCAQLPKTSRAAVQKHIKAGGVLVNTKPVSVHHFLKKDDAVQWMELPSQKKSKRSGETKRTATPAESIQSPEIIQESADWIVLNKPTGLLVHPDGKTEEPSLIDWLLKHAPAVAKVGEDPSRPGIVHRLDREVSGLMVIAKTQSAYEDLKKQFAEHSTEKTYLALVHGEMPRDEGDIKFRIARSSSKARMAARPKTEEEGRAAWTHYVLEERFVGASLVKLTILSGRTHQIRAHLHALGHGVIGDPLYTHKKTDRNIKTPRLMLQSVGLAFTDPSTHERLRFSLNPDPLFSKFIQEFRHS